jgi:NADH-quinone oxidoreductase subunit N
VNLNNLDSLAYAWPEAILAGGVLLVLLLEIFARSKRGIGELAAVIAALATFATAYGQADGDYGYLFDRMVALDAFSVFFKIVLGAGAFGAIWMSLGSRELRGQHEGEYYALLLAATLGMFYMAEATNMLMAYLALEFVSQTSYILSGFIKTSRRSGEAALKYLIYGGVASGAMVYGMSLLFGLTGSLDYATIGERLTTVQGSEPVLFLATVLIVAGFGYKISMVPFHMWTPDVYEGAPLPVTAFLAVASKAAGVAMLVRFFYPAISVPGEAGAWLPLKGVDWQSLMVMASMVTMTLGNLAALRQTNVKRLLAYSSIAHAGYMLMGFVALSDDGLRAMLFYVVVYYLMNLGAFVVLLMVLNHSGREDIDAFRGLAWRGGAIPAAAMAVFLFSLAGIPPFAGFIGKFYLFAAVIDKKMWMLAIVAGLNSVVALYYYARLVRTMYLDLPTPEDAPIPYDSLQGNFACALVIFTLILGVYWTPLAELAKRSIVFAGS